MENNATENFIEKVKMVHKDKYDYSQTIYKNARTKIEIICLIHGKFLQLPHSHLKRNGCPKCGNLKSIAAYRSTSQEFITKAQKIHGLRYDYLLVNYINKKIKVIIKSKREST